jgi:arylsulfatase
MCRSSFGIPTSRVTARAVRDGVLAAVESVINLDADFWKAFADPNATERYSFGLYFSPLGINRPTDVASLSAHNDVVLYDRENDPAELRNLALDPANEALVAEYSAKLERMITAEIGDDMHTWVLERPNLGAWPSWHGDEAA